MAGGCPSGPHCAPAWSSDGTHDQVSQAAGKAGGLAPGGPLCPVGLGRGTEATNLQDELGGRGARLDLGLVASLVSFLFLQLLLPSLQHLWCLPF